MQNTITNIDKQRFTPFTVGFDDLFDRLFDMEVNTSSGYPPYNIIKLDDYNYHIEIAVAGFNENDISIEMKKLLSDQSYLNSILSDGAQEANELSEKNMN